MLALRLNRLHYSFHLFYLSVQSALYIERRFVNDISQSSLKKYVPSSTPVPYSRICSSKGPNSISMESERAWYQGGEVTEKKWRTWVKIVDMLFLKRACNFGFFENCWRFGSKGNWFILFGDKQGTFKWRFHRFYFRSNMCWRIPWTAIQGYG